MTLRTTESMEINKDLIAASSTPIVLAILAEGDSYGYAILQRVREVSRGRMEWTDGMLYPVLHRLERLGNVEARWEFADTGRRRKYYRITRRGRGQLDAERSQWQAVDATLRSIWKDLRVAVPSAGRRWLTTCPDSLNPGSRNTGGTMRLQSDSAYRIAAGLALAVAFLIVFMNVAAGLLGIEDDDPANLLYVGVLAIGFFGGIIARFQPQGLARAMFATAVALALVGAFALNYPNTAGPVQIVLLHGLFVALFSGAGVLFRYAAREHFPRAAATS